MSWLEPAPISEGTTSDDIWRLQTSRYDAVTDTWSPAVTVTQRRDFFVNWADIPCIAQAGNGAVVATWLQHSGPGTYAYDIGVARSVDDGRTWTMLGTLNDDRIVGEHGFVSMTVQGDNLRAVWLDGREMTGDGHSGHGGGDMTLRTAVIGDTISPSTLLDARTCECCPTSITTASTGPVVLYRDRDDSERRDISVTRLVDGIWTTPADLHRDNWEIAGCPVNGPSLDAHGSNVLAVWYTAGDAPGVHSTFSTDSGQTFAARTTLANDAALGRVAAAVGPNGTNWAAWFEMIDDAPRLQLAHRDSPVATWSIRTLAPIPGGRRSGYPGLAALRGEAIVAWTAEHPSQGIAVERLKAGKNGLLSPFESTLPPPPR